MVSEVLDTSAGTVAVHQGNPSKYAQRLPQHSSSGNAAIDEEMNAAHKLVVDIIATLQHDHRLALPLYNKMRDLQKSKADHRPSESYFTKLAVVGKIDDEAWMIDPLASNSDMTTTQLLEAKKIDEDAPAQLLGHMTQLNPLLKAKPELRNKAILRRLFESRSHDMKHPLRTFRANKGFEKNKGLNWSHGSYRLKSVENKITQLVFRDGNEVDVSNEGLSDAYTIGMNWSDWRAQLQRPPFPPLKLHFFFKQSGTGPYQLGKNWAVGSDEYSQKVAAVVQQYNEQLKGVSTASASSEVVQELKVMEQDKKKASMQKAREVAKTKLSEKKGKQVVKLTLKH